MEKTKELQIVGVDRELTLYELTDLFWSYYKYHNEGCLVDYEDVFVTYQQKIKTRRKSLSRFAALRTIEKCRLSARPFSSSAKLAPHMPNRNMGYMNLLLKYLALPYKAMFTDSDLVKVRVNKKLYMMNKLSDKELEQLKLQEKNNPILTNNKEVGDDISDVFSEVIGLSRDLQSGFSVLASKIGQTGLYGFVHSDLDWIPRLVDPLDLVTEPLALCDSSTWSSFFVIRRMSAQEVVSKIRGNSRFWNTDALRWALESAIEGNCLLGTNHYSDALPIHDAENPIGENYTIQSFYNDKGLRRANLNSYYGDLFVVDGYYKNANGKVDHVIFFPSQEYYGTSKKDRDYREDKGIDEGAVLFHRTNVFRTMDEAITIIPFDKSETVLERQRAYGHELFGPIEQLMKLDCAILNLAQFSGFPLFKKSGGKSSGGNLEDVELKLNGAIQALPEDLEFIELPIRGDLNSLLNVRSMLSNHVRALAFLGGLDGNEQMASGRGANLANLRLVRDGRIHKHTSEDFSKGLTDLFRILFRRILDFKDKPLSDDRVLLNRRFYDVLFKVLGHDEELFDFEKEDIIPDTKLPYWFDVTSIRNGASHFGAAELILYSEIKNVFGDGLTQQAIDSLNRMGIKALLGHQDAIDILGDPKDQIVTSQDQMYRAYMENATILGSVDGDTVGFESVPVLSDKDDHIMHASQVHVPKAKEILDLLRNSEVSPQELQTYSESDLTTRNSLILKVAALANHLMLHQQNLERFGSKRDDVNRLKEEINSVMQASEGLLSNLQTNLRVLEQKRAEKEARLQNLSPENEAEKMKQQNELTKLQAQREESQAKLRLANRLADDKAKQHMDMQLSKARDRGLKERELEINRSLAIEEMRIKSNSNTESST